MKTLVLVKGLAKRSLIEIRRYPLDTLSGLIVLFVVFVIIFYGAKAIVAPGAQADTLPGIVVGFFVWTLALFAYGDSTQDLQQEAMTGTLEQLAMSPFGLVRVMAARFVAGLTYQLITLSALLVLMMAASGRWLNVDVVSLLPLLLLTVAGVYGLGLALGGVAIVFKRTAQMLQIVQFLFIGLIAVPLDRFGFLRWAPLAFGSKLISHSMVDEVSIFNMAIGDLLFLVANTTLWLGGGIAAFRSFEAVARDRALLGHY